jgi:hypothetical protein
MKYYNPSEEDKDKIVSSSKLDLCISMAGISSIMKEGFREGICFYVKNILPAKLLAEKEGIDA